MQETHALVLNDQVDRAVATLSREIRPLSIDEIMTYAEMFAKSGLFSDVKSQAQAFVRIQAGQELGVGPYASMRGMHTWGGKPPEPGAIIIAAVIKKSGAWDYRIDTLTAEGCTITILRRTHQGWVEEGSASFGKHDAEIAEIWEREERTSKAEPKKLIDKWNYKSWGEDMYFARALTRAAKRYCPHLTFGLGIGRAIEDDIAEMMEPREDTAGVDAPQEETTPAEQARSDRFRKKTFALADPLLKTGEITREEFSQFYHRYYETETLQPSDWEDLAACLEATPHRVVASIRLFPIRDAQGWEWSSVHRFLHDYFQTPVLSNHHWKTLATALKKQPEAVIARVTQFVESEERRALQVKLSEILDSGRLSEEEQGALFATLKTGHIPSMTAAWERHRGLLEDDSTPEFDNTSATEES